MDEAVVVGMEEVDWRNMPRKQEWSWVWRRLIGEYAQETRVVVGMEKENSEICPESKSGRGHGGGKFGNIPKKQKRRGYEKGKFRNMPKKQEWSWVWRRKIQKYAQAARVVVGMEEENSEICPRSKSGRGYGEGKFRNIPKKQEWSWVWRRKIQKYTQKARVVVGMEEENSEIYPESKSGRGHGGGKFRNIPKKQKRRGHGEGKFRNIPKKQEWSWVWKGKY